MEYSFEKDTLDKNVSIMNENERQTGDADHFASYNVN